MDKHGLVMVLVLAVLMARTALMALMQLQVMVASDGDGQCDGPVCLCMWSFRRIERCPSVSGGCHDAAVAELQPRA